MTEYEAGLPVVVAFPPEEAYSLAHARRDAGWRQFHLAETEKYAHVTYFFNGGREAPLRNEHRLLVPSPKVATYDLQPAMSATGVADALVEAIALRRVRPDRGELREPGHGRPHGCLGGDGRGARDDRRLPGPRRGRLDAADRRDPDGPGSLLVVTADHGNAEVMRDADGRPVTAHSLSPVPVVIAGRAVEGRALHDGVLADVAATICELTGLPPLGLDDRGVAARARLGADRFERVIPSTAVRRRRTS